MNSPLPPRALPAHPHPPKLLITASAIAAALGYLVWLRLTGASPASRGAVAAGLFIVLDAVLVGLFWRASLRPALATRMVRALRLLAGAAAVALVGRVIALSPLLAGSAPPSASLADLFLVASYPLTLAAFLAIPTSGRTTDRWKLLFDAGMVISGVGSALWYFVLRETAVSGAAPALGVALALVYPLADLLILVTIVTVLLHRPADGDRRALEWLAISAALGVADDLFRSLLLARGGPLGVVWADALHFTACIALVASAERFTHSSSGRDETGRAVLASRFVSALPFLAAGWTYALLLGAATRQWVAPTSGLAVGAVAVSLFLGARQLLATRRQAEVVAERTLHASEARFRSLVQHSSDLIFVLDANGVIQFASSSASRVMGYEPASLVGVSLSALSDPEDAARVSAFLEMTAQLRGVSPLSEWRLRRPDGQTVEVEAVASNLLDDSSVGGIVLNARDVGERKALLDQLAHQAFHDPLTGLANRALFRDRVMHAITLARRQGRAVTVLYLDLDDFKQINDSLGHAEGDRLLALIAARLGACARSTDTVARLGGDEFAVLVEDAESSVSAERLVERIREQMGYPFTLATGDVSITASIGSASTATGGIDELLRYADLAMYAAKRSGRGLHRAFEPGMLERR
ncbi:MAG TPA: sensor domain-containing diguanylate cyclase [Gemmatimonadaceae bacterium]|nr:sensor domain-containing diguanylate cyclase [Gemmatimonadaceae bacterium]